MLRYVSLIAPLLMRRGTSNPVKAMTGYVGALFLSVFAGIFFLATIFTWVSEQYGLDVAFLTIALIFTAGAVSLTVMARVPRNVELKKLADREAEIKGLLAAGQDPLSGHIPDELLTHPVSQQILAQIEDRPWTASAAAMGLGLLISRQLVDAD